MRVRVPHPHRVQLNIPCRRLQMIAFIGAEAKRPGLSGGLARSKPASAMTSMSSSSRRSVLSKRDHWGSPLALIDEASVKNRHIDRHSGDIGGRQGQNITGKHDHIGIFTRLDRTLHLILKFGLG